MAQLIINIPEDQKERVLTALAERYEWDGTGSRTAFIKAYLINVLKRNVIAQERDNAARAAAAVGEPDLE